MIDYQYYLKRIKEYHGVPGKYIGLDHADGKISDHDHAYMIYTGFIYGLGDYVLSSDSLSQLTSEERLNYLRKRSVKEVDLHHFYRVYDFPIPHVPKLVKWGLRGSPIDFLIDDLVTRMSYLSKDELLRRAKDYYRV